MNQEVKEKWLAALRSGEYKQAGGRLRNANNQFCCLGVLCDLYHKETGLGEWGRDAYSGNIGFKGRSRVIATGLPTLDVCEWAGLNQNNPIITGTGDPDETLSKLNDKGWSFSDIAGLIEAQL